MQRTPDKNFISAEGAFWSDHLFQNILPFWLNHAIDAEGGINTCIDDQGKVISRDKWIWSQMRAVWVFSRLHNTLDAKGCWLDLALHIYNYVKDRAWLEDRQGWALCLDGEGNIVRGYESIYVDGFALYGMSELYRATSSTRLLDRIQRTAAGVRKTLKTPHDQIPHFPYAIPPGARVHGIPMIFSHTFDCMAGIPGDNWEQLALDLGDEVLAHYLRKESGLIVERCTEGGTPLSSPEGTVVVPGHVIESLWFQIHLRRNAGQESTLPHLFRLLKRHLEFGWDEPYGGLFLAKDLHGSDNIAWDYPDVKLWWPHTEALYATFLAYILSGDEEFRQWYEKVKSYALEHFAAIPGSEWIQKLDRYGRPITDIVALPVKDPFHLPRSLIMMIEQSRDTSGAPLPQAELVKA